MKKIVIADDDEQIRRLIRVTLLSSLDVTVFEARDGISAVEVARREQPDLIILDVDMPGLTGIECCQVLRTEPGLDSVPVVLVTAFGDLSVRRAGHAAGATQLFTKPFSPRALIECVEGILNQPQAARDFRVAVLGSAGPSPLDPQIQAYATDLALSLRQMKESHAQLQQAYLATVAALATALEMRDGETAGHCRRVSDITLRLAGDVGYPPEQREALKFGALLHDVGKIGISDAILRKPARLTDKERELMQLHPALGVQILETVEFLRQALPVVRCHHEWWDGRGYPQGLRGDQIPLAARLFAVADALDAMTTDRPYRAALSWDAAYAEIVNHRGSQFDPDVVDAFRRCADQLRTGTYLESAAIASAC